MNNIEKLVQQGVELNNTINKLNEESKVLNDIIKEKRDSKISNIINDLKPYCEAMKSLDIETIDFGVKDSMKYSGSYKPMGVEIRKWNRAGEDKFQINLILYSNVLDGVFAYHSLSDVLSGITRLEILNEFLDKWGKISQTLEIGFVNSLSKILDKRKQEAIKEREKAITTLTKMS